MGIREQLNQNSKLAIAIAVTAVLVLGYLVFSSSGARPSIDGQAKAWFTTDDGKTYFADDLSKQPPFQKDGRTAYGCYVWSSDGGKTTWVSHLYRHTGGANEAGQRRSLANEFAGSNMEVKRPGDTAWVKATDPRGIEIQRPKAPGGGSVIEPVEPQ